MAGKSLPGAGIRKRAQIDKENSKMFLWVAGCSVVVGFALVACIFLVQMILFNEKVLQAKNQTVSNLQSNNAIIGDLEDKVRALDANSALISAKANPGDETLQVVLDALPGEANSLALGASLQNKLLGGIAGLTINSLRVNPVVGVETLDSSGTSSATSELSNTENSITFTFTVAGSDATLKQALVNLEKSIRTIDIISLTIEGQGNNQEIMTVEARAFYEPAKALQLTDKVIKQ